MQWLMLIMIVTANGETSFAEPHVYYNKTACRDAQEVIKEMTPRNSIATVITACTRRGGQ